MSDDTTIVTGGDTPAPPARSRLSRGLAAFLLLVLVLAASMWLLLPGSDTGPDVTGVGDAVGLAIPTATGGSSTVSTAGVVVPSVIGKSQADADKSVTGSGLVPAHTFQAATEPAGDAIDQSPAAGTRVSAGDVVDIVVSTGLSNGTSSAPASGTSVPSVLGLSLSAARDRLSQAGWNSTVNYGPGTAVPGGIVYFQSPGGQTVVSSRRTVTLWVSTGSFTGGSPYPRPPLNDHTGW
jgi:beta-lactam-binding protein with PASTA domain